MTNIRKFQIKKNCSLIDIERIMIDASQASEEIVEVWLPRNFRPALFIENRLFALFLTISNQHKLHIVDWVGKGNDGSKERFSENIAGIAALWYSQKITNAGKEKVTLDTEEIFNVVERNGGLLEKNASLKTMTFCAFDSEIAQQPLTFSRCHIKEDFRKQFVKSYRTAFSKNTIISEVSNIETPINRVADFVYELYENSFTHGCLDAKSKVIPGIRILQLHRHIGSVDSLLAKSSDSTLLRNYFDKIFSDSKNRKFYEISISDQGLGIVKRFEESRPNYSFAEQGALSEQDKFKLIIERSLSSKLHQKGTGHGLSRALAAIQDLKGFISIRFGNEWLVADCTKSDSITDIHSIYPTGTKSKLANISGTHINIIIVAE